jgi:alpha/beta superfamily hydrolase
VPLQTVILGTADGLNLEGDLLLPADPWAAAVVAHPHPLYGGDRHNNVVDALSRGLHDAGVATVRFDFRGVGRSEGTHDEGAAERLDIVAAIDAVAPFAGDGPLVLAGYSFGALVALDVTDPRLDAWLLVAPPIATRPTEPLAASDHRPKLVLLPEHDQYSPPAVAGARIESWPAARVEVVPQADHFLAGRTGFVAERAVAFAESLRPA